VIARPRRHPTWAFDVLYLRRSSIGRPGAKRAENTLHARRDDPGSPWRSAARPADTRDSSDLGTIEDSCALLRAAAERGIEVALDSRCNVRSPGGCAKPSWFKQARGRLIRTAGEPGQALRDIYASSFAGPDWEGAMATIRDVSNTGSPRV